MEWVQAGLSGANALYASVAWGAAQLEEPADDGDDLQLTETNLALLAILGLVSLTVLTWLVMQLTRHLMDVCKLILFIWVAIGLYNYFTGVAATSMHAVRLLTFVYNTTSALLHQ